MFCMLHTASCALESWRQQTETIKEKLVVMHMPEHKDDQGTQITRNDDTLSKHEQEVTVQSLSNLPGLGMGNEALLQQCLVSSPDSCLAQQLLAEELCPLPRFLPSCL